MTSDSSVGKLACLAAARAQLGEEHAVAAVRHAIVARIPDFSAEQFMPTRPFKRPEDAEHLLEGLRKAGLS